MVATRRGVRVLSPTKSSQQQPSDVQATPSTGRITRRTTRQAESDGQQSLAEAVLVLRRSEAEGFAPAATSPPRRCSRASRLHSPEQPCTPAGSTHEGEVSDVESCCSTVSMPLTSTRSRRKQARVLSQEEDLSEVESCSSAVSPPNSRRSTRNPASADPTDHTADESRVSAVTRSQRKSARTRSAAKLQQQLSGELSDTDSYLSSASGADASVSTRRRATRSRTQASSIPIHLDVAAESSAPSTPTRRSSRATARGQSAASDPQSCDSEGFEIASSRSTRRGGKARVLDSDSEPSQISSPRSTRSRGTPCSSRTGSGSSSRDAPAARRSTRQLGVVQEKPVELLVEEEEDNATLDDSQLENTVLEEDAECTLVLWEGEGVEEGSQGERVEEDDVCAPCVPEEKENTSCAEEVGKPAVVVDAQQGEPCDDNQEQSSPEMEATEETLSASGKPEAPLAPTAALSETVDDTEGFEMADVGRDAATETQLGKDEEEMVDSASPGNSHPALECGEDIQVTSSQQAAVTVEPSAEHLPADTITVSKKVISLLDSSEDEEEEEEEEGEEQQEEEEEEEEEVKELSEEETAGPPAKSQADCTAMGGMFMIDTRPGQDVDEDYYMTKEAEEKKTEQEEKDEEDDEFVDEEGEDDDEETTNMLYSSRNPLVKEMSSRIDPGIRVKELGGLYINFDGSKSKPVSSSLQKLKEKKIQDEVMKKSIIGPDFEKKDAVPPYKESKHALKLKHREEKAKTTGDAWFNMKAPELTKELKGDLQVLKMRGSLDSKRFYKKNDRDGFPKYFQVGTVVDNPVDFYHSRVPKKARKRTMVEELLADAEFRQNNKRKYQQVVAEQAAQRAGKKIKKKISKK